MKTIFLKKTIILSLLSFVLIKAGIAKPQETTPQPTTPANTSTTPTVTPSETSTPQKLEGTEMKFLNTILEKRPDVTLKAKSAHDTAKKILARLEAENYLDEKTEQQLITECKEKLLKPVNKFFEPLHSYKGILQPLIKKILLGDADVKKIKTENLPFCYLFFDATSQNASIFFDTLLTSREIIKRGCQEFISLFGVVNASISDEANKKADELYKKIQEVANKRNKS